MNDFEKQKLGMYESVLTLLSENKDIVTTVRSFSSNITKLRRAMDEIRRVDRELSSEILDKTIQNAKAKDELIIFLEPVTTALFNFARKTDNFTLKEKTRLTKSQFVRMLDKDLMYKAELIRELGEANLAQLRKFGVRQHDIEALAERLGIFRNTFDNKVSSLISSSTVVFLSDLFAKADEILTVMDAFVESLEDEYEEFYDEYLESRDLSNQDQKKALMELEEEDEIED
ncbi:MAG: hypothetical protein Q8933_14920 [Bacteroidota bacterium]|nr:hypothetical protein [Bacteroidota bacterium]MDP4191876.1 hypothetical protein [Bacteroidota bacterium]MDP4194864.1 hypothetical protein [Bacteroidota bacterium]